MKNSLFRKILAVGATLALVSSFFVAVPVSAAPGCNTWGDINMPDFAPNTELGVMDVAPDGTIFLAVWTHPADFENEGAPPTGVAADDGYWLVKYSTDGGFTWKNTNMPEVYDNDPWRTDGDTGTFTGATPVSIKVSPMWPNNKNVYVALTDGTVWRLPNAGLGTPAPLRTITDEKSQNLGVAADAADSTFLWDMDIWADGTYNYLAVATDLDVFVIKDQLLAEWVDYQLNVELADGRTARAVRFAPDFATSELIWALVAGDEREHNDALGELDDQLYLVSADSPARWGYVFEPVEFVLYGGGKADDTRFVDIAFDPDYTSALPQLYVAIANDNPFIDIENGEPAETIKNASEIGNLWFVSGEASSIGPGDMDSGYIFFEDQALGTVQVSGSTIMVQNSWTGDVYTTNDRGNTWPVAKRSPAGKYWGHLLMSPNYATDKTVYSTSFDGGWSDGTTNTDWGIPRGGISGVYRSTDGGVFFDGISLLDMPKTGYSIKDLAFDPKGGSQPALMVINSGTGASAADYIFYTADATAAKVQWLMKDCMTNIKKGVEPLDAINLISWDEAGSVVMLMGLIDTDYYVFRSYDEGNSFAYWRTMPVATVGVPADWVVVDNNTISVAGASGYWGTRAIGTEIKVNLSTAAASIARQGNNIAIGTKVGSVRYSSDAGKTWDLSVEVGGSNADTFVAFASDGTIYAAAGGGAVTSIVAGKTALGADTLITTGKSPVAAKNGKLNLSAVTGIWASPDNTLYVMGSPVSVGTGLRLADNTEITLDATPPLSTPPMYTAYKSPAPADAKIWVSEISIVSGDIEVGDEVEFYSADVKTYSSSTAQGYIWVVAFDDDDNIKGIGEFEIVINDADNPFAMFEKWPADLNVSFEPFDVAAVASTAGSTSVSRLLLGEKDNVWEQKVKAGVGLWGTTGSNLVWTVVGNGIAALEDFNSGAVQNVTVKEVDKNASKAAKSLEVSWSALPCTSCYEIYVYVGDNLVDIVEVAKAPATGFFDAGTTLSTKLTDMDYATKYDVQVRACEGARLQSRLSAKVSATTECYNVAPTPQVPVQGMQDASLAPSFVWAAPTAGCAPVKYDFQLSTDPNFGSFIIDTTVTGTGYTYTARDLAYDTDHYWRVRSVAADGTKSNWTTVQNFHTMLEPVEPVPPVTVTQNPPQTVVVTVPPPQTFTIPAPQTITVPPQVTLTQTVTSVAGPTISVPDQPTPAYIWVIVAVGAVLTIAVIVLIVRTRRAE